MFYGFAAEYGLFTRKAERDHGYFARCVLSQRTYGCRNHRKDGYEQNDDLLKLAVHLCLIRSGHQSPFTEYHRPITLFEQTRKFSARPQEMKAMTVYLIAHVKVTDDAWVPAYAAIA